MRPIDRKWSIKRVWCWLFHRRLHSQIIDTSVRINEPGICGWSCISCYRNYMFNTPNRSRLHDKGCI